VPAGDYYVSMWAQTHPGATCYAHVVYTTGYDRYRTMAATIVVGGTQERPNLPVLRF
jgi:hypothetical protein